MNILSVKVAKIMILKYQDVKIRKFKVFRLQRYRDLDCQVAKIKHFYI